MGPQWSSYRWKQLNHRSFWSQVALTAEIDLGKLSCSTSVWVVQKWEVRQMAFKQGTWTLGIFGPSEHVGESHRSLDQDCPCLFWSSIEPRTLGHVAPCPPSSFVVPGTAAKEQENLKLKVLARTCASLFLFFIFLSINSYIHVIFQNLRLALDLWYSYTWFQR